MKIAIPTFHREDRQTTWSRLPEFLKQKTILFTHSGRAKLLKKAVPEAEVVDTGTRHGIADARQAVVDFCALDGHSKIWMMDDQCHFFKRASTTKLLPLEPEDTASWQALWGQMEFLLDAFPQVGLSPRLGNNRKEGSLGFAGRAYGCVGLNLPWLESMEARFDGMWRKDKELTLYEDFYLLLKLLDSGQPNALIYDWCFNYHHGHPGGNNMTRSNELQKKCAEALAAEFPHAVQVVQKTTRNWITNKQEPRWDVKVGWKKALDAGRAKK